LNNVNKEPTIYSISERSSFSESASISEESKSDDIKIQNNPPESFIELFNKDREMKRKKLKIIGEK